MQKFQSMLEDCISYSLLIKLINIEIILRNIINNEKLIPLSSIR